MKASKTLIVLLVTVLLLFAMGTCIEYIHSSYFHYGNGFKIYSLSTTDRAVIAMITTSGSSPLRRQKLIDWADENDSAVMVPDGYSALAVCDCSGRVQEFLRRAGVPDSAPCLDAGTKGVYLAKEPGIDAFVKNGVFTVGTFRLPVLGYYDKSKMPEILRVPFIYSLSEFSYIESTIYTDNWEDSATIKKILGDVDERQIIIEVNDYGGIWGFISLLFYDPMLTRSRTHVFYMCLALSACVIFGGLMLFREPRYSLSIHHLFGMTRMRMGSYSILISAAVVAVSALSYRLGMEFATVRLFDAGEKLQLTMVLLCVAAVLAVIINVAGMLYISKSLNGGTLHEGD